MNSLIVTVIQHADAAAVQNNTKCKISSSSKGRLMRERKMKFSDKLNTAVSYLNMYRIISSLC